VVNLVFQSLIVLSGAAVRLTQSGLGCEDWPTCNDRQIVPELQLHGWIEFGNRLISLVVTAAAVAAVVGAMRLAPRRTDLLRLSWWLAGGTLAQIVLGGLTVLLDLNPLMVSAHFLVSMGLLWVAVLLVRRADPGGPIPPAEVTTPATARLLRLLPFPAGLVLFTGTVVTGTGPHSGDERAVRFPFDFTEVVRFHTVTVWIFLAVLVTLAVQIGRRPESFDEARLGGRRGPRSFFGLLLAATVAQGGIGYTQFFLGVPALLVEFHVAGAVSVWLLTAALYLSVHDRGTGLSSTNEEVEADVATSDRPGAATVRSSH
jgi:cytochrome c oxidase assembly protein subunit 15